MRRPLPAGHATHWTRKSLRSIGALILREMATTHGRSPGGYLWAVLEPAAGIGLLTLIFSLAFHEPPIGDSFPVFYATGLLPFILYVQIYSRLMVAIWFSKPLLQYPTITFMDALVSRFLLALLTQILVFLAVVGGLLALFEPRVTIAFDKVVFCFAMGACLGAGVGVLNCLLISLWPVWQRIWNVFHRPMFVISGIFFTFDSVPEPYRSILWYNPVIHVVGAMRQAFYPTYEGTYVSPAYVFAIGLGTLAAGLFLLQRWHKDILYQ